MIYKPFIKQGYRPKYFSNVSSDDIYEVPTEVDTGDVLSEDISTEVSEDLPQLDFSWTQDINYKFPDKGSFKSRMLSEYKSALKAKGLDPAFAKSLVAQDALESAWGSKPSGLYNYGGIKGSGKLMQTTEYLNGELVTMKDNFRDFSSLRDYVNYKIDLLNSPRYDVFSGDVSEFAHRVKLGGYATSPNYEQSLNNVIRNMKRGGVLKFQEGGVNDAKKKGLSYPEFWVNLRDSNRPWSIDEHGNAYTHKMAWGEYDGNYIIYPEAQVENGILVDYSKYRDLAIERALANGEYVIAPSAEIAEEFTREWAMRSKEDIIAEQNRR